MKRPSMRSVLTWLVLAAVAAVAVYKLKFAPVSVISHTVKRGDISAEVMGTGTLEARLKTTVSARIQERLMEVMVDQGDAVKAGQLLARLDAAEMKQQVAVAEATLAAATQTAERVRADLDRAEAVLAQARRDSARLERLVADKAVSQSDVEKAAEGLHVAEADLKRSNAAIAEAQGQVVVAEKNLLYRKEQLAFTEIHSPFDGLVIRRDRDPGDMVVPGASLMQIISLSELWISAWVDETAMPALETNQPARIIFRSESGRSYPGKVSRLGREMDRETREFRVDVRAEELPKSWTTGQRAEVFIVTGQQADAVLVPLSFLEWRAEKAGVFLNDDGVARWHEVEVGLSGRDHVAITRGLSAGEQIVRLPDGKQSALTGGQRIVLQP